MRRPSPYYPTGLVRCTPCTFGPWTFVEAEQPHDLVCAASPSLPFLGALRRPSRSARRGQRLCAARQRRADGDAETRRARARRRRRRRCCTSERRQRHGGQRAERGAVNNFPHANKFPRANVCSRQQMRCVYVNGKSRTVCSTKVLPMPRGQGGPAG